MYIDLQKEQNMIVVQGSSLCNHDPSLPCWGHVNHMVHVIDHARDHFGIQAIEFAKFKLCTRE